MARSVRMARARAMRWAQKPFGARGKSAHSHRPLTLYVLAGLLRLPTVAVPSACNSTSLLSTSLTALSMRPALSGRVALAFAARASRVVRKRSLVEVIPPLPAARSVSGVFPG
jgi:hypothetical protein